MEKFEVLLKQYILETGNTIYQFSKITGISRVNVQRYLSGIRLPSVFVLNRMMEYLHINNKERKELTESYKMRSIGEKLYYQREYIKQIIGSSMKAGQLESQLKSIDLWQVPKAELPELPAYQKVEGRLSVIQYLQYAMHRISGQPEAYMYLFLPPVDGLEDQLFPGYKAGGEPVFKRVTVIQLVQLLKKTSDEKMGFYNLRILKNIIPLCFGSGYGYQVYFYYHSSAGSVGEGFLFPYYVIFNDQAVYLSEDLEHAIALSEQKLIDSMKERFLNVIGSVDPFISYIDNLEELLIRFVNEDAKASVRYSVEYQPCLFTWMDSEMVDRALRMEVKNRETMKRLLTERVNQLRENKHVCHYFTKEGIDELVECGTSPDFPPQYAVPFSVKDRITLLERMRGACRADTGKIRFLQKDSVNISRLIPIYMSDPMGVDLILYDQEMGFRYILVKEQTICDAFQDFIETMDEDGLVMTAEKTMDILEEYLNRLRNME